ncbi:Na+/H+ antiporter [Microbacterium sp. P06]|uniref:Na+/H+ antiporter n=1 Tax=unclassified Microbacterium TaxID=2609290 RepID=UPI003746C670
MPMEGLEIVVILGISVFVGAILAPRVRVAMPLLLLVIGLCLGFVPELREIELPPETVLLIFLPVILFWESLTTSLRSIRRALRGIVLMSTLLVVATAFGAAGVAHLLGLPWAAALVLGAAIAPPDATAVAALGRTLPRRNFMLLKAESLTNDGTALVLYAIAVGVAVGGQYTPLSITGLVLLSYGGGLLAGAVVAGAAFLVMRRLQDPLLINVALVLVPFTAYLIAELIGASGVLAVVATGLIITFLSPQVSTPASRRQTEWTWPLGSLFLNGSLFVLVGLQVQVVVREIDMRQMSSLILMTIAVWATLLVVRFAFQTVSVGIIRLLDRRPSQRDRRMTHRARIVSTVAGFRGAVSLAIALSVPLTLSNGDPFPGREEILFVTVGVILLTLLVQGPLLPFVVRWARLPTDTEEADELELAERVTLEAAIEAIDGLAEQLDVPEDARDRLIQEYRERRELLEAQTELASEEAAANPQDETLADDDAVDPEPVAREEAFKRLRLAVLDRKRAVLLQLLRDGVIDDTVARTLQTRMDVEQLRVTGVEPVD